MKREILAAFVGSVVLFLLGWLTYGIILMDYFSGLSETMAGIYKSEEEMDLVMIFVGNVFGAGLLTYIFSSFKLMSGWLSGLKAGLIIGISMSAYFDFIMYGTTNLMNMQGVLSDVVVAGFNLAITGAVIGHLLKD